MDFNVYVRKTVIKTPDAGEKPLICVPIVSEDEEGILAACRRIMETPADLVEWRADYFRESNSLGRISEVLAKLREICGDIPLIFTYRMKDEGGEEGKESPISIPEYLEIAGCVAQTRKADIIDLQVISLLDAEIEANAVIRDMHRAGMKVIGSNHDCMATPDQDEMMGLFDIMYSAGADIVKLAVMPNNKNDVLSLMETTIDATYSFPVPVISMSMGKEGAISRIAGSLTGSAITFASAGEASAPGQLPADKVAMMLDILA